MNESKNLIKLTDEISTILLVRSRELDRREKWDKEISNKIKSLLKKK